MTKTTIETNCSNLFYSSAPLFAQLPNITFHSDKNVIGFISKVFDCKLAIWPMFPRYNEFGELDNFDDNLSLESLWSEWGNSYNQEYIVECCTCRCGIFETNNCIVVPQNISLADMSSFLPILQFEEQRFFVEISKIAETCGWLMAYLYEQNLFLLLTDKSYIDKTKSILEPVL